MKKLREGEGFKKSLSEREKVPVLQWFGHIERMERERLVKKNWIYRADVKGNRVGE